ncbi:MAG: sigma-70 family RNA polymerase sigma factor [Clostridium sp.]
MEKYRLVKLAKKGNGKAYVELVKEYEMTLYKIASRMLGNNEDVADALQETITIGYEKISTLNKAEYFNTWICKILINTCNRVLNQRKQVVDIEEYTSLKSNENGYLKVEMDEALNSISYDYKVCLVLFYIGGFSIKEISSYLDEPEGTIKSRLSRGKARLREKYFNCEDGVING